MKVSIDQDLCTGDGLCEEIAPDVFFETNDGLFYVKEFPDNFDTETLFDGAANPAGPEGIARISDGGLERSSSRPRNASASAYSSTRMRTPQHGDE